MAAPTATKTGNGNSKTAGTTLAVTVTTTAYSLGDYVVVGFSCDPATGTVSFAKTAGTAVIGSWTTAQDIPTGSGTSGVRSVLAYAKVTTAGTITTITVTHPSLTARTAIVHLIAGADPTTPINVSGSAAAVGGAAFATLTPTPAGPDCCGILHGGLEAASGAVPASTTGNISSDVGWTVVFNDTASVGTTGSGAASNISALSAAYTHLAIGSTSIQAISMAPSGISNAHIAAVFQAPFIAAPASLTPTVISSSEIDLSWASVTGATSYTLDRSPDGSTGWSNVFTGAGTTFNNTGLSVGTQYFYRVSATGPNATSLYTTANATTRKLLPFTDSFSTGTTWNSADWAITTVSSAATSVSGGVGVISSLDTTTNPQSTAGIYLTSTGSVAGDQGVVFRALLSDASEEAWAVICGDGLWDSLGHAPNPNSGYSFALRASTNGTDATSIDLYSYVNGDHGTDLVPVGAVVMPMFGTWFWMRLELVGTTVRCRKWADGSSEPSTWLASVTDTTNTAGRAAVGAMPGTGATSKYANFDDLTYYIPAPTGLAATTASTTQINLSWSARTGATSYTLDRSPDGSTGWSNAFTGSATSFNNTGLSAGTPYYYRLSSTSISGTSNYATATATTTGGTAIPKPRGWGFPLA